MAQTNMPSSNFEHVPAFLLEVVQERSLESLWQRIMRHVSEDPRLNTMIALIRVWVIDEGDLCSACPMRARCSDQTRCLHLVVRGGNDLDLSGNHSDLTEWPARIPLGVGTIGKIGVNGQPVEIENLAASGENLLQNDFVQREQVRGFHGVPIIYRGEVLGVMALLVRMPVLEEGRIWISIFANYIAGAIANARAFEEIQQLKVRLELENTYLQEEVVEARAFGALVGQSAALNKIAGQIDVVAPTDATVLILGETGTGKELVAHEIHKRSSRKDQPLIRVNCASIPKELYESEFFGHVKGAFTGAFKDRAGRLEAAHGGTLFLDEIAEIPLELQSKLLRALQEKQYERVGEDKTRRADVRIIAATNRDLKQEAEAGRFRQDLYYRLNVFPIQVAPLREHAEDIPLLARHFVDLSVRELRCARPRLTQAGLAKLQGYDWPGNVRELRNMIERAAILARGGTLNFDLPRSAAAPTRSSPVTRMGGRTGMEILTEPELRQRERENLLAALTKTDWKIYGHGGAAELLAAKPTTLLSRMKKMRLKRPD
jgi:transcriptional regulator with GAF, ATPase, and Fis domain